jgi:hypothetical protein
VRSIEWCDKTLQLDPNNAKVWAGLEIWGRDWGGGDQGSEIRGVRSVGGGVRLGFEIGGSNNGQLDRGG